MARAPAANPHKDALAQVAAALGLHAETSPTTITEAVADLVRRRTAETTIRQTAEDDRNRYRSALETAASAMETAALSLAVARERCGTSQAYADMTVAGDLLTEASRLASAQLAQ